MFPIGKALNQRKNNVDFWFHAVDKQGQSHSAQSPPYADHSLYHPTDSFAPVIIPTEFPPYNKHKYG